MKNKEENQDGEQFGSSIEVIFENGYKSIKCNGVEMVHMLKSIGFEANGGYPIFHFDILATDVKIKANNVGTTFSISK